MVQKQRYIKPPLTYQEQLDLLKHRGLMVHNDDKALHLLSNLSYYRFSAYLHPFLEKPKAEHVFKSSTTFDDAFKLYKFDREFRSIIFNELEKIEISIRAQLIYIYSHEYNPYWYTKRGLFKDEIKHQKTLNNIQKDFNKSHAEFAVTFKKKYNNQYPPSWIALETCSFGALSMLYDNVKEGKTKKEVAKKYGLPDKVLVSWLHSFVVIRNICAHHARLWNVTLAVSPSNLRTPKYPWINMQQINTKKVYYIIVTIQYMLFSINPSTSFKEKLQHLLNQNPHIDPYAMGFPEDTFEQKFWQKQL